jgi:streptogramin lyase
VLGPALAALCCSASASAAPTITEFPLASPDHSPLSAIASGPGGFVWFTESTGLGLSTVNGEITQRNLRNGKTESVALGPDGNMWFTQPGPGAGLVARMTPGGEESEFFLPSGATGFPAGITAGPDGNLWFTEDRNPGAIGRITTSGAISEFKTGLLAGGEAHAITAGPDGNLWFTESGKPGAIGRITPSGAITEFRAGLTPNSEPRGITAGPDGNLWFTESGKPGAIGRITPSGAITEFSAGLTEASEPQAIAAADDGNLYFTERAKPGAIGRITTSGAITEYRAGLTPNNEPQGITAGPDGNVWFTEDRNPGTIGRITVAPGISPAGVSGVSATTAVLHAWVGPNNQATTYHVEYGTSAAYGSRTLAGFAGAGAASVAVSAPVGGLAPLTLYHFRAVASNAAGTTYGPDETFVTLSFPLAQLYGATGDAPVLGRSAGVALVAGTVLVHTPGSRGRSPLTGARIVPMGSVVDARRGTVRLTTATDRGGHFQSAILWQGTFSIHQRTSRHGLTTLALDGVRALCPRASAHRSRGSASARASSRRPARSLWAKDNHGHFSTRGENSVATVRGTYWETVNRCDGTLTVVSKGAVSVRDIHRHRTVLVTAGRSYLARA